MNGAAIQISRWRVAFAFVVFLCWLPVVQAQSSGREKIPFRNAAVHGDLLSRYEEAKAKDPIQKLGQDPELIAKARAWEPPSLLENSEVLAFQEGATFLPKGSILHVPEDLVSRVDSVKSGMRVMGWAEFLRLNSSWVVPLKIRLEQAMGKEPIDENLISRVARSGKVVVAIYFDNPITVLRTPPEEPVQQAKR